MYASVQDFDFDVPDLDAVLLGLDSDEKHIFLDPSQGSNRRRFTLAHELGHILVPWHLAHDLMCNADSDASPDDEPQSGESRRLLSRASAKSREIRKQELEADAFAARALVPISFIQSISQLTVDKMLLNLECAEVSVVAGMRALAESLPAGYVFALLDDDGCVERVWLSGPKRSGVLRPFGLTIGEPVDKDLALLSMSETGWGYHYGHRIWWARAQMDIDVAVEGQDPRAILGELVRDHTDDDASAFDMSQSVSAIGGALVNDVSEATLSRMAGLLATRLKRRVELATFVNDPRFENYVSARAWVLHRRLLKKLLDAASSAR